MQMARLVLHLDLHPKAAVVVSADLGCFVRRLHMAPVDLPKRLLFLDGAYPSLIQNGVQQRASGLGAFFMFEAFILISLSALQLGYWYCFGFCRSVSFFRTDG